MPKILIVDDVATNINILKEVLDNATTDIFFATNGVKALEVAESCIPDIILLDIMMPKMDGYDVCKQLKANLITKHIPVIFITALDDDDDETKGLKLGGVDYITKPINASIVQARVQTHLTLKQAQDDLEQKNIALEEESRLRDQVEHIIRHDLKTPLGGMIGFAQIMLDKELTVEKQRKFLQMIEDAGHKMLALIDNSLNLYKMEIGKYAYQADRIEIISILKKIVIETKSLADIQHIDIKIRLNTQNLTESDEFYVTGEHLLCYSLCANLCKNAIEASPQNGIVTIFLSHNKNNSSISLHNQGLVPVEIRDRFFERYITAGKFGGTGLGTYSAKLMTETQGGSIHFETEEALGTTVTVQLQKA